MSTRHLYLVRHGAANAFGQLTEPGTRQMRLLGRRLAHLPIDVVWHSPLSRAAASASIIAEHLPSVPVIEAPELIDHVPYVPPTEEMPQSWVGFFDGYTDAVAAEGQQIATTLIARFAACSASTARGTPADSHEIVITHSYPIAWLVRHAMQAPPARWLGLDSANGALTLIEHRRGLPPALVLFNDMGHLPRELQWTGFRRAARP